MVNEVPAATVGSSGHCSRHQPIVSGSLPQRALPVPGVASSVVLGTAVVARHQLVAVSFASAPMRAGESWIAVPTTVCAAVMVTSSMRRPPQRR